MNYFVCKFFNLNTMAPLKFLSIIVMNLICTETCAYPKFLFNKLASDVAIFPHNFNFPAKLRVLLIGLILCQSQLRNAHTHSGTAG